MSIVPADDLPSAGAAGGLVPQDDLPGYKPPKAEKAPERTWGEVASDTALGVGKGLIGVAKLVPMAVGAADTVISKAFGLGEPASGGALANPVTQGLESAEQYLQGKKSEAIQAKEAQAQAQAEKTGEEYKDTAVIGGVPVGRIAAEFASRFASALTDPAMLVQGISENVATILPAGAAGRAAQVGAEVVLPKVARNLTEEAVSKAARTAGVAGGISTGAVQQGADVASEAYDKVMQLPDDVWQKNAQFNELVGQIGPEKAKQRIAGELATEAGVKAGLESLVVNAAGARFGGATLESIFLKPAAGAGTTAGKAAAGGAAKGFVRGGVGEMVTEAPEEAYGALAANQAAAQVDPNTDIFKGVGAAGGIGAATAFGMGSVVGARQGAAEGLISRQRAQAEEALRAARDATGAATAADIMAGDLDNMLRQTAEGELSQAVGAYLTPDGRIVTPMAPAAAQPAPGCPAMAELLQRIDREAELRQQAAQATGDFERRMALEQIRDTQPAPRERTADQFADLTPMDVRQAQNRLTVLRDQTAQQGGNALELIIAPHPSQPGKLAIARQQTPSLDLQAPAPTVTPQEAQFRIETAALTGKVDQAKQEDRDSRQVVIDRALRSVEERGGVASPAEARIFQEAGLGKPYDRIDESLGQNLSTDEKLTQATGIPLVGTPREAGSESQRLASLEQANAEGMAELTARTESNRAQRERETQAAVEQTSQAPAVPDVGPVLSALATPGAQRTAEQNLAIRQAEQRMSGADFSILQRAATAPFRLSQEERLRLRELRNPSAPAQSVVSVQQTSENTDLLGERVRRALETPSNGEIVTGDIKMSTTRGVPGETVTVTDSGTSHQLNVTDGLANTPGLTAAIRQFARLFGKRVVFFKSDTLKADGFVRSGNSRDIFINTNSQMSPLAVFGHELMHLLKRDNPVAYRAVAAVVARRMDAETRAKFRADYGKGASLEELSSDLMGNAFQDEEFLTDVFREIEQLAPEGQAKGIINRLAAAINKAIKQALAVIRQLPKDAQGFKADELVKNLEDVRAALKRALVAYAQQQREPAMRQEMEQAQAEAQTNLAAGVETEDVTTSPARVMFEVAPDPNNKELKDRWDAESNARKLEISQRVAEKIMPKVFEAAGVKAQMLPQLGGYLDDTNPSFAAVVEDANDAQALLDVARLGGFALAQDSMMVLSADPFEGSFQTGLITIKLPASLTSQDKVHEVYEQVRALSPDNIQGHTTVGNEMVLAVPYEAIAPLTQQVAERLRQRPENFDVQYGEGQMAFPEKKDYDYGSDSKTGPAELLAKREVARDLRQEASAAIEAELGAGGEASFSKTRKQKVTDIEQGRVVEQSEPLTPEQWAAVRQIGLDRLPGDAQAEVLRAEQQYLTAGERADEDSARYKDQATKALDKLPTPQLSTVELLKGNATVPVKGSGRNGKVRVFDVARALRTRFLKRAGDITTEQGREAIARAMAHEALYSLSMDGHAIGWYDRKVHEALAVTALAHPEVLTNPEANFAFRVIAAVTSNGQAVRDNFILGNDLYKVWRDSGTFPTEFESGGPRASAMKKAFAKINGLIEQLGWETTEQELMRLRPVRDIEAAFELKISGENKDTLVPAAVGMGGPKIGNFFANLSGYFDSPTMDLWFMRTVGRMAGTILETKAGLVGYLDALLDILPAKGEVNGVSVAKMRQEVEAYKALAPERRLDPEATIRTLRNVDRYARAQYTKFASLDENGKTFTDRSPANLNARSLVSNLSALVEAPTSGTQRNDLRQVVERTLFLLNKQGIKLTAADLQAVLWYYEKNLYAKLGDINESAKPWDYASAARFGVGRELGLVDVGASKRAGQVREGELSELDLQRPEGLREGVPEDDGSGTEVTLSPQRAAAEYAEVEARYKGTDQWLKAPNGKDTNLTERQWVQVRTPSFKAWFGPWDEYGVGTENGTVWNDAEGKVSKVVDDNGEPLVVYHGTIDGGFSIFREPGGRARGDLGIFATPNLEMAKTYVTKGRPSEIEFDNMEREPLNSDENTERRPGYYASFMNLRDPQESDFEGAYWNGERPGQYVVMKDDEQQYTPEGKGYFDLFDDANTFARENGGTVEPAPEHYETTDSVVRDARKYNDGAIIRNVVDSGSGTANSYAGEPTDVFVAFKPNQLKSATQNTGEFGTDTNDLRFSRSRAELRAAADAIAAMDEETRDNTELGNFPGAASGYNLYEGRKLLPKPSNKLKRVTENNTFGLWQNYDYIANVDGEVFGVTKQEDPDEVDDESKFVYQFERLDDPFASSVTTTTDQVDELFKEIRASMAGDITQSRQRIVGDSKRAYTPEQQAYFERVGRTVTTPTIKERVQELRKDLGKKMAQGLADQFRPIKDLSKDAYMLARLSKGAAGAFEALLHHGKLSITGDKVYDADMSGGFIERVGVPLHGELEDFLWWVAANRAERLTKEDRENLFTADDIAAGKSLDNGTTDWDYTLQHATQGKPAGTVTRDRTLIYRDALKTFDEFNKNALDMAEQSGLIDAESRPFWEHEFYVPFYRVSDAENGGVMGAKVKSGLVRQEAFKRLKGGSQKLNSDLLANTLSNWGHLIDASAKNRAALETLEAARKLGIAIEADEKTVRQMGKSIGKRDGVVSVMDQGKERFYLVDDPMLLTAITSLDYAGLRGPIMDAMSTMKHWLTVGVTASPAFKIRNLVRDSVQAVATAPLSYNIAKNLKEGFQASDRGSQTYVSALASGGLIRFGTMLEGSQAKRTRQLIKMGVKDSTILDSESKVQAMYDKYLEPAIMAYNELGNRGEEINRSALFKQLRDQGMSQGEAALMARDLMDFSMQGSWASIRFLTQVVPFMNARLQGLYKLGRASAEDKARFGAVLGAVAVASIGLMLAYQDDDDWKKREDWDRNNNWWFKIGGVAFRIPKPFEIGSMATLAERGLEYFISPEMTGKRLYKNYKDIFLDSLSMNPTPQLVKPIVDLYANKDSFTGRPIETMGMERLKPQYRYTQGTSMAARGLSTATGGLLSPVQYDHLIRGYFSWLGSMAVTASDAVLRPATGQATRPAPDYWRVATGGILAEVDGASSRYVSQMYDQAKELEQAMGTYRMLMKTGRVEEAREFYRDNKEAINRYGAVEKVKAAETRYNEMIRMIERSSMDPEVKKERIRELQARKDRVARVVAPGAR